MSLFCDLSSIKYTNLSTDKTYEHKSVDGARKGRDEMKWIAKKAGEVERERERNLCKGKKINDP